MRRLSGFLCFSVIILVLFSCDFQIPSAVELKGNPALVFAAKTDIGEMLQEKLDNVSGFELITCTNTNLRTYILRRDLTSSINLSGKNPGIIGQGPVPPAGVDIYTNHVDISVNFIDVLPEFELKPVRARLYIHGSNLTSVIKVNINSAAFNFNTEVINISNNRYSGTNLPGNAKSEILIPLSDAISTIYFSIFIPGGETVNAAWFDESLKAELLIWLPLEFEAISDDAQIVFPDDFLFSGGDLFGREEPDDSNPISDYVESLELSINLKQNAFKGRELIVWSGTGNYFDPGNIVIKHVLTGNAFVIPIDSETMELINDPANHPFSPKFLFEYKTDEELKIPREFVSTEFVFKAKLSYRIEF